MKKFNLFGLLLISSLSPYLANATVSCLTTQISDTAILFHIFRKIKEKKDDNFEDQLQLTQVFSLMGNANPINADSKMQDSTEFSDLIKKTSEEKISPENQIKSKLDGELLLEKNNAFLKEDSLDLASFQPDQNEIDFQDVIEFTQKSEIDLQNENGSEIHLDSNLLTNHEEKNKEKDYKEKDHKETALNNPLKQEIVNFHKEKSSFNETEKIFSFEKNLSENFLDSINKKIKSISDIQNMNKLKDVKTFNEFKIKMRPDHLGEIHIKLTSKDNQIFLEIKSDNEKLKEVLEGSMNNLKENLSKQNFLLSKMDVEVLKNQESEHINNKKELENSFYNESHRDFSNSESFGENSQKNRNQYENNENTGFFESKKDAINKKTGLNPFQGSLSSNQSINFLI